MMVYVLKIWSEKFLSLVSQLTLFSFFGSLKHGKSTRHFR